MKLGKANYGGEFTRKKFFKLKDGEQKFRILPPMGDLADKGIWSKYYSVHFGYFDSKGKMRPFQSPLVKNTKTKEVEVADAALDRIKKLQEELEKAQESGNEEAVKSLTELVGFGGRFNLDKNHYMNVLDSQGNIGILAIRHKAKQALETAIKKLRASGVDPLSPTDGRAFVFTRVGTGNDTAFTVEVEQEHLTVEGVGAVKRDKSYSLSDEVIARLKNEAGELDKIFPSPTAEEVERIVKEGPKAVDEILGTRTKSANQEVEEEAVDEDDENTTKEVAQPTTTATSKPANVAETAKNEQVSTAKTSTKSNTTATSATQTATATPATTTQPATKQTHEEFLKSLGL